MKELRLGNSCEALEDSHSLVSCLALCSYKQLMAQSEEPVSDAVLGTHLQ